MRTDLSSLIAEAQKEGCVPVQYLVFKIPDGDWLYVSDRPYEYTGGSYCAALVVSWGELVDQAGSSELIYDAVLPQREYKVSVLNTQRTGWFASNFARGLRQNIEVELWQGFEAETPPAAKLIDKFVLQTPLSVSSRDITVDLTLRSRMMASDPVVGVQDHQGGWYDLPVGGVTLKARLYGVQPLAKAAAAVNAAASEIGTDRDLRAAGWASSGMAKIDLEVFFYTSIDGQTFKGVTGISKLHDSGSWIIEPSYNYKFGVCATPATVSTVNAGGEEVVSGYFSSSSGGVLVITFATLPSKLVESKSRHTVSATLPTTSFELTDDAFRTAHIEGGSIYLDSGSWLNHVVAVSDRGFGLEFPAGADVVSGKISCKFRLYDFPGVFTNSARATVKLGTFLRTLWWSDIDGDYTDFTFSVETDSMLDFSSGGMYIDYNANSDDVTTKTLCAVHGGLSAEAVYESDDPGYPKVQYFFDDITVVISGTTENPADLCNRLMGQKGLGVYSLSAARSLMDEIGMSFAGVITGSMTVNQAIESALKQCRGRIISNGGNFIFQRQDSAEALPILKNFTDHDIDPDGLELTQPDQGRVANSVLVKYNKDSLTGDYAGSYEVSNGDSVSAYGLHSVDIDGYLIRTDSHAKKIADYLVSTSSTPPSLMKVTCYLDAMAAEIGDRLGLLTQWSGIELFAGLAVRTVRRFAAAGAVNRIEFDLLGQLLPFVRQSLAAAFRYAGTIAVRAPRRVALSVARLVFIASISVAKVGSTRLTARLVMVPSVAVRGPIRVNLTASMQYSSPAVVITKLGAGFGYSPMGTFFWGY